ncbi:MAG TPA: two-component regulator propeller domain-containing protein, partial [Nevskiaceae bacterium]|nr:two-component regulator propeller domain-containing protein [Nevskiaceae bacterium]
MHRFLAAAVVFCCLATPIPVGAADTARWFSLADTIFRNLGPEDGLPNRTVTAVAEDADGFLWVGTQGGLARWDGYRFRVFRAEPDDPHGLPDGFIDSLHTDREGRLWIGTRSRGLVRYDADRDRFQVYDATSAGLSHGSVRAIVDDGAGGLWIGTQAGLDRLPRNGSVVAHLQLSDPGTLRTGAIESLLLDARGTLWIGTGHALFRRSRGMGAFTMVTMALPPGSDGAAVLAIEEDSTGGIWLGTDQGAYVIGRNETAAQRVPGTPQRVNGIVESIPGEMWIGTDGHGLLAIDAKTRAARPIRHDASRPTSLSSDAVRTLYRDRAGQVWVGTSEGLGRHAAGGDSVLTLFGGTERSDGISERDVLSVLEAPDGRVWLGLYTRGVDVLDPGGTRVAALRPDPARPDTALPEDHVLALVAGGDSVWMGTNKGLYRSDMAARTVSRVTFAPGRPEMPVYSLLADDTGLWIGSYGGGLHRLDAATGGATLAVPADRLTDGRVVALAPAGRSQVWVGTLGGVNRLDPVSGEVERIVPDPRDPQSLSSGYVTSFVTDQRGRLWVSTLGGGINVLETRDLDGTPRFRRLGTDQGLPSSNVEKLIVDRQGRIWASADDGIAIIDPESFAVQVLRHAEGVGFPGYWVNAGTATSRGEVMFGGSGGLTIVRPDRLPSWDYRAPVVVTEIKSGGERVPTGPFNGNGSGTPITVTPGANSLSVEFALLDTSAPERNHYAYRLDGFDKQWIETDYTRRVASYTNLPPGDYALRLRASNRIGVWNEAVQVVPVRVLPAWYQSIWFKGGLGILGLLLLFAIVRSRTSWLQHRQKILEALVTERTAELQLRTDELTEAHHQLEQIAYFDSLTGLANRRMFQTDLHRQVAQARRSRKHFTLLLIDLDRFKSVNDTLGHDAGDALLFEAGARFKASVRDSDFVARLGGDEFAILLPESYDREGIETVCRRIVQKFETPVPYGGQFIKTSPSIGVATYPDHGDTEERLFKSADIA